MSTPSTHPTPQQATAMQVQVNDAVLAACAASGCHSTMRLPGLGYLVRQRGRGATGSSVLLAPQLGPRLGFVDVRAGGGPPEHCPHCSQAFRDAVELVAHVERSHSGPSFRRKWLSWAIPL